MNPLTRSPRGQALYERTRWVVELDRRVDRAIRAGTALDAILAALAHRLGDAGGSDPGFVAGRRRR